MPLDVQLQGAGAGALRVFLATRLGPAQLNRADVKQLLLGEAKDALTMAEFRLVADLLGDLRASDPSTPSLAALLRQGSGLQARAVSTEQEQIEQDEESREKRAKYLARRREKLLRLDEEMRYGSMVRNVKTQTADRELASHQTSVRQHLSVGANMVMARVTAFIAVYFVARNLTQNETTRLVAGLGGAIVMMVIEMVLFIARAAKIESIEHDQRKHKSVF
ncbi:ATPase, vacuolar ER assembly factor, Vma12 [Phytophthora cinnamomi]|uniref:ATPase, vacuolar ER assembly factor, Vma12 n=1 Tax=Phytophthora cinnamomi TaxID=4785 RepID=UPI0035597AF9|nr:ATPase, vacuolar ER assembly factor, Vma12 [Phytophthora cinnamomi]